MSDGKKPKPAGAASPAEGGTPSGKRLTTVKQRNRKKPAKPAPSLRLPKFLREPIDTDSDMWLRSVDVVTRLHGPDRQPGEPARWTWTQAQIHAAMMFIIFGEPKPSSPGAEALTAAAFKSDIPAQTGAAVDPGTPAGDWDGVLDPGSNNET